MHQFITISTDNYLKYTYLLYNSLIKTNPKAYLKIYCDTQVFKNFFNNKPRCEAIILPEIKKLGPYRARFAAYYKSCNKPTVYMDSDIIVLKDLSELFKNNTIAASTDDLYRCPFIPDKIHPWKNAPELVNKIYVCSGFFYYPKKYLHFFYKMYKASLNDSLWEKYSDPLLTDNHFLCAFINMEKIKIKKLDNYKYGWQGLFSESGHAVKLVDNSLINTNTNRSLSLVHLFGIFPPDLRIKQMPEDVRTFLLKMGLPETNKKDDDIHKTYNDILEMYFNTMTREVTDEEKLYLIDDYFDVIINPFTDSITAKPQETLKVKVEITNKSKYDYSRESFYPVNIAYHIFDENNQLIVFDGLRTKLPETIKPNESLTAVVNVIAPEKKGKYLLQIDLVKESIAWFQHRNKRNYRNVVLFVSW